MKIVKYLLIVVACSFAGQAFAAKDDKLPRAAKPKFSHESGFYPQEFKLKLSHKDPRAVIYYTLDGSEPDPENLDGKTYRYKNEYQQPPKKSGEKVIIKDNFLYNEYKTYKYSKSILIKDRTFEPDRISQISTTFDAKPNYFPKPKPADTWRNSLIDFANKGVGFLNKILNKIRYLVHKIKGEDKKPLKVFIPDFNPVDYSNEWSFKGTPVRAIAVLPNHRPSKIVTHTLFIGDKEQFSLPIIAITVPEKDLFDYDEGRFVAGVDYDEFVKKGKDVKGAKHHRPSNWKNNKNTYFKGDIDLLDFNKNFQVKVKVHGDGSKAKALKSFRIKVNKKNKIPGKYIFDENSNIELSYFNLRNAGQAGSHSYFKDAALHAIASGLNAGTQSYAPKITFINGEYNGILNARERRDVNYLIENYKLSKENINLIKGGGIVQEGNKKYWKKFDDYILNTSAEAKDYKKQITDFIDLDSWADYYITETYYGNVDWPSKNMAYWMQDLESGERKWRWLIFDLDASFSNYGANQNPKVNGIKHITKEDGNGYPNPDWATRPVYKLLKNQEIKEFFIIRALDLINTTFLPSRTAEIVQQMESGIVKEMPRHIKRWKSPSNIQNWKNSIYNIESFFVQRPKFYNEHLQEFFKLDDLYTAKINVSDKQAGTVKLNTLHLGLTDDELEKPVAASARATHMTDVLAFPWQGEYFQNMPLNLEAVTRPGYAFSHWETTGIELSKQQLTNPKVEIKPTGDVSIQAVFIKL